MLRSFAKAPLFSGAIRGHGMQAGQKRSMSGLVKKNYFVEEWNGRREITEKTFKFNSETVPTLIALALVFPAFIYFVMRDENDKKYKRLGKHHEQM